MTRRILLAIAAVAMTFSIVGAAQAQTRASVRLYNNSNQNLTFTLQAQGSTGWDRYTIRPRQYRRFTANAGYVSRFTVRIATTGRGTKVYSLRPSRTYQFKWDRRIGLWNVFTMGRGGQSRPFVRVYNNSGRWLNFSMKSSNSRWGNYRIGPRRWKTLYASTSYTRFFIVRILTTGRGEKRYTLVQGRRYQLKWDRRIGLWNVFTMR